MRYLKKLSVLLFCLVLAFPVWADGKDPVYYDNPELLQDTEEFRATGLHESLDRVVEALLKRNLISASYSYELARMNRDLNPKDKAATAYFLAQQYEEQMTYGKALAYYQEAAKHVPDNWNYIAAQIPVFYSIQHYDAALQQLHKALDLARKKKDREQIIISLQLLGWFYKDQYHDAAAAMAYETLIAFMTPLLAERDLRWLHYYPYLAKIYYEQQKYKKAEALYHEAIAIGENQMDTSGLWKAYSGLARMYWVRSQGNKAIPFYEKAVSLEEMFIKEHSFPVSNREYVFSELYKIQGRYDEHPPLHVQMIKTWEKNSQKIQHSFVDHLHALGRIHKTQERWNEAEPYYMKAIYQFREVYGEQKAMPSSWYNDLATIYRHQNRLKEAEQLYLNTLTFEEQNPQQSEMTLLDLHRNLGHLYSVQSQTDKAIAAYEEAVTIAEQKYASILPWQVDMYEDLFMEYAKLGYYGKMQQLWEERFLPQLKKVHSDDRQKLKKLRDRFESMLQKPLVTGK